MAESESIVPVGKIENLILFTNISRLAVSIRTQRGERTASENGYLLMD